MLMGRDYVQNLSNNCSCEVDKFLLRNLNYSIDTPDNRGGLLMAQQESHAFKFADRIVVNFQCSIRLNIKDSDECPVRAYVCVCVRVQTFLIQRPQCADSRTVLSLRR